MANNNYEFASATLETAEGLKVDVGSEYINDPDFDEQMRNVIITVNRKDIDVEFILDDLQDIFNPQDSDVYFSEPAEQVDYTTFNLFFDPEKVTDETEFNEIILDVIYHLHCYWSGKLTIENF